LKHIATHAQLTELYDRLSCQFKVFYLFSKANVVSILS